MVGRLLEGQFIEQQRTGRSYFPKPAFSIQIQSGVFFEAAIVNGVQWKNGWKLSSAEGLFESFDELVIAVPLMSMSFMPSFLLEADIIGAKKSIKQSMYCVITSLRIGDAEWDELTFQNPLIEVITKHQDSLFVELTLEWSTAHWDQNENWIEERVMQTVQELLEEEVRGDIKCYRKSRQTVFVQSDCIRNGSRHLSFIGDYFHAGGVQSSWLSGVSCAARILANIE
jgi:predicted NAD/FAD-dependent oxidoreductase